jgi:multiple sugar transport system permease protein
MKERVGLVKYLVLSILMIFLLFPVYWMISTSFKTNMAIYKVPPEWFPQAPTWDSYINLFQGGQFFGYYLNNFKVSILTTLATILMAVFAGYTLSRFRFKGNKAVMVALLSTQMFPVVGLLIALYAFFKSLHLLNTTAGLVFALTAMSLPFCIWLIKGFFDDIPYSLEEAAAIDGCSRFGILFRIVLPLSKPGLLAIGIYTFLQAWDDFLMCLTLITNDALRTLSTGISLKFLGELSYDWATVMTISVIATVPLLLLFIFFQRYMIQGLTAGGVKG